ncbi:MAG: DNA-binding protein WhiA [Lachnospiraceae bacterium]|nr:DNA-binding protein WhiA [Lachnospiraceae bacterium]
MAEGFSRETKEWLSRVSVKSRSGQLAELNALTAGIGQLLVEETGQIKLLLQSENLPAVRRGDFLLRSLCPGGSQCSLFLGGKGKGALYSVSLEAPAAVKKLLKSLGLMNERGVLRDIELPPLAELTQQETAARAFLRGAFLGGGYVSDPEVEYHWEVVVPGQGRAQALKSLLEQWELPAKVTLRKGKYLVYMKEAEAISTALSLMGAQQSMLQWESARAFRSLQGQVNRQVNCETGNLARVSRAGVEQIKAIRKIREGRGLDSLPPALREIALLRLENPETSLKELGEMLTPPVGKSGVNHRLRKLLEIAEESPEV